MRNQENEADPHNSLSFRECCCCTALYNTLQDCSCSVRSAAEGKRALNQAQKENFEGKCVCVSRKEEEERILQSKEVSTLMVKK